MVGEPITGTANCHEMLRTIRVRRKKACGLAKASDQFRQSDVTAWAIVALVAATLAVLISNISAALPAGALAALHTSRVAGTSVGQLRASVGSLETELSRIRRENDLLTARLSMIEQSGGEATRRLGALEVALPQMLEAARAPIFDDVSTASIPSRGDLRPAEGGSVRVETSPLSLGSPSQPRPEPIADVAYGIAVGSRIEAGEAGTAWDDLVMKLGPLMLGFSPLLAEVPGGDAMRIIVGPTRDLAEATGLCGRIERVAISCQPVPYLGTPLP